MISKIRLIVKKQEMYLKIFIGKLKFFLNLTKKIKGLKNQFQNQLIGFLAKKNTVLSLRMIVYHQVIFFNFVEIYLINIKMIKKYFV